MKFYWFHAEEKGLYRVNGLARASSPEEAIGIFKKEAAHSHADDLLTLEGIQELNETEGQPRIIFFDAHDLAPEEAAS